MMVYRPSGILGKLLLVALPPLLLLALLLSVYVVDARLDDLDRKFRDHGAENAQQLASTVVLGLFTRDRQMLQSDSRRHLLQDAEILEVVVRDASAKVVARAQRLGLPEYDSSSTWFSAVVERPIVQANDAAVLSPSDPLGEVAVRFSNQQVQLAGRRIARTTVLISSTAVLLTVLIAILIGRQIVHPIQRLRRAVQRLREGDLSVRVPETSSGEIGELEEGFNSMAAEIASVADELHGEVEQATADLQQTMDALEVRNIELDIARKRAIAASAAKSDFLAGMSHEIRTPMNGVLGFADLLRKTSLDDLQQGYVETIIASGKVLLMNLNEILDYSKMEAGKLMLERRQFGLREVVADTVRLFGAKAQNKGLTLTFDVERRVPDGLIGDSLRLHQILNNLVSNGVKFTQRGGVALHVAIAEQDPISVRLKFVVRDSGIGIADDKLDQLFQPFSQANAETTRLYGGTGLGLSICKRLAEAMGGEIGASSTQSEGSVFVVELPFKRATVNATGAKESATSQSMRPVEAWLNGLRFLIVDDNEVNLNLLDALLRGYGAETVRAFDGKQAVREASSGEFDMALIDIHMPLCDGVSATVEIHAEEPELPVVALTADVTQLRRLSDNDGQFAGCLLKPMSAGALCRMIERTLGLSYTRKHDYIPSESAKVGAVAPLSVCDTQCAPNRADRSHAVADALLNEFRATLPSAVARIDEAAGTDDREALWQAAHWLQGAAATCSLTALYDALGALAHIVRSGEKAAIADALAIVHDEAKRIDDLGA